MGWFIDNVGVAHRDIKCDNILLKRELAVRIADFRSASHFGPSAFLQYCGKFDELGTRSATCASRSSNLQVDIWAVGVTLYEVCRRATVQVRYFDRPFQGDPKRH